MRKTTWITWIWFVGFAVWTVAGAIHLHYRARADAKLDLMLALLFLVAGLFYRRQQQ
jgi:hypothetical protein